MSKNRKRRFAGFSFLMAAAALCLGAPPGVLRTNVPLEWDYPTNELSTNLLFKIYSSTNLSSPVTNWSLYSTVVGTNTRAIVPLDAQQRFFVLTASNYWGESSFSNVTNVPPPPRHTNSVRLGP